MPAGRAATPLAFAGVDARGLSVEDMPTGDIAIGKGRAVAGPARLAMRVARQEDAEPSPPP